MSSLRLAHLVLASQVLACGSSDEPKPAPPIAACAPPSREVAGVCLAPGVADDGCPAGTVMGPADACRPAGIAPEECGEGFVHDGDAGCEPVLPAAPCPPGSMASIGETTCRPVMACAPVEGATDYVDGSYTGADSDGSAARPWVTIGDAVVAASSGAVVAVAAGSYTEDVVLSGKPLVLAGVCPEQVEIVGAGTELAVVSVVNGADGSVVRGVALRGAGAGMFVSGAERVVADRIWVHDTTARGIDVERAYGDASLTVVDSLIEGARQAGVYVSGSTAVIERTTVRGTLAQVGNGGHGVHVQNTCTPDGCDSTARADATVRGCVVEQNVDAGVLAVGSDLVVESTVVRGTMPSSADVGGRGITVGVTCVGSACDPEARANATITSSVVEHNHDAGVFVFGADAIVESSVVRDTQPSALDGRRGKGIDAQVGCTDDGCDTALRSQVSVGHSLIDRNHEAGISVQGSTLQLEAVVVRRSLPVANDASLGVGIIAGVVCFGGACEPTARAALTIRGSIVEACHDAGILVAGSDATVEATVVRGMLPRPSDGWMGRGVSVNLLCVMPVGCDPSALGTATVRTSVIEDNHDVGVFAAGADVTLESTAVRRTVARPSDGLYGDGVAVFGSIGATHLQLDHALVEDSARAGLSNFGANVGLASSAIRCAAFELEGEPHGSSPFSFEDSGGNVCGCPPAPDAPCSAVSVGLAPPVSP